MSKMKVAFKMLKASDNDLTEGIKDINSLVDELIEEVQDTINEMDEIVKNTLYHWEDIIKDNGGIRRFLIKWDRDEFVDEGGTEEEADAIDELVDYIDENRDIVEFILDNPNFIQDLEKVKSILKKYI